MIKNTLLGFALSFFGTTGIVHASEPITPQEAATKISKGEAILIDVREEEEVKETGKAKPAIWLPKSAIDSENDAYKKVMASLPKDKTIITYCAGGGRAGNFATDLTKKGYKAYNMGGFSDWKKAGLPVTK